MRTTIMGTIAVIALLAGCSGGDDSVAAEPAPTTAAPTTTTPAPTATEQWDAARAFLAEQTKPTEVVCGYQKSARPAEFYDVDQDTDQWMSSLYFRDDPHAKSEDRQCSINVPASVPYTTDGIEGFLRPLGFSFSEGAERDGLVRVEIAYAGSTSDDPDIVFKDAPGLFGAWLAVTGAKRDLEPKDEAQAQEFLDASQPLLDWYNYQSA